MADDSNFRSNPPVDPRWPAQAAPARGGNERNDPLAELARLIGQTDPFGELNRGNAPTAAHAPVRPAAAPGRAARPPIPPQRRPEAPGDPYGSPLQFDGRGFAEPRNDAFQPAYDPAIYGAPEPQVSGHPSDARYDDPSHRPHGEGVYDDDYEEERPHRGVLKFVVALAVLVFIGTGGVMGYRWIFSGAPSGDPKVIKANTAPTKIVPAPTAEASNNKQIYDRVGENASQGERVVSREEKPVEVKDTSRPAPRLAFPSMPGSANSQDTAMATASSLATDSAGPNPAGEPRKVRTVPIRPEATAGAPASRPSAGAPSRSAGEPTMAIPAGSSSNAPLSLSPQVASADISARPPALPAAKPTAAAPAVPPTRLAAIPPATEVAPDSYTVQISSQRSEADAQASFRSLQGKFPTLLGDRQPIIRKADLGDKGIFFRTMVGPFASIDEAKQFCGNLKSAGGQCVVPRN